jgi:endoglucanase
MKMKIPFLCLFVCCCLLLSAQPVQQHGKLHVSGTQLMDEHNQPVVLRGMSYGWHNLWPRFYNEQSAAWLAKDWHCSVLRAAMGVELNDSGYLHQPDWSQGKIEAVVNSAIRQGIYVIIDWHCHNIKLPEAKGFFAKMATKYGKYPNVIYEIYNEPDYESWDSVKIYSKQVIDTIRSIDKDNIILVGNPHWDQDIHTVAADPLTGYTNIMYTVHFYAATHKQWLRDRCDAALVKGIAIFISESAGMEASGDGPLNEEEWNKWIAWAEDKKISWITWSVSDKDETCSVLQKSASSDGNWKDEDLKESGLKSKALLKKYNP